MIAQQQYQYHWNLAGRRVHADALAEFNAAFDEPGAAQGIVERIARAFVPGPFERVAGDADVFVLQLVHQHRRPTAHQEQQAEAGVGQVALLAVVIEAGPAPAAVAPANAASPDFPGWSRFDDCTVSFAVTFNE